MPLAIDVRLREARYAAAEQRNDRPEWPPHPARLFCALVASAQAESERELLRRLEAAAAPQVWAPELIGASVEDSFVVTNQTSRKGGSPAWPGRTSAPKHRVAALPGDTEFSFVWPDVEFDHRSVELLGELAWRVPYLGRSTSSVALRVHTAPRQRDSWQEYRPTTLDQPADAGLRVPYPGYLAALDAAFAEGRSAWEEARTIPYVLATGSPASDGPASEPVVEGPFSHLAVFSVAPQSVRPDGIDLLRVTDTLRDAAMKRIGEDIPAQVSGHAGDRQRHVAFLGLPDVGRPHATGQLVGLALALPRDLDAAARQTIYDHVIPMTALTMGRFGRLRIAHERWPGHPQVLRPALWSGRSHRGAGCRRWVTATPLMLDRYTRPNSDLAAYIRRALVTAGYPEPVGVEWAPAPMVPGALPRPRPGTYPPNRPRRKLVHARIAFAEPVLGPVLAGSMRYLGLGLFLPEFPDAPNGTEAVDADARAR